MQRLISLVACFAICLFVTREVLPQGKVVRVVTNEAVEKIFRGSRVGIQQQKPIALTEPTAFIDRPGKAAIARPAP